MSRIENCIKRREQGLTPMTLECMECLKELTCPVYQEYKASKDKINDRKVGVPA